MLFSRLANRVPQSSPPSGFAGGLVVGFSLGLLWTPCVGPILASVITLALAETVTANTFLVTLAYSLGTAISMLLIMAGGRKLLQSVPWLMRNTEKIQKAFGVLMLITAFAMLAGIDRQFQSFILDRFPMYGVGLTRLEENTAIFNELKVLNG